jgi:nucleoside-triphosphate--adenylate kinase
MQTLTIRSTARPATRAQNANSSRRFLSGSTSSQNPFILNAMRASAKQTRDPEQEEASRGRVLRMLMFGKPGAGKGTLSARLVKKYDIVSLSTGDLLRQHIQER